ncbi:MAG: hypothetical protein V3V99_09215 [candidate division Zixibacteria bacterium]
MKIGNYDFEGPFQLQSWNAPQKAGAYSILHNNGSTYNVDYVGKSENLADRGFPWSHHRSNCWVNSAGSKSNVYIAVHFMPGSTKQQRTAVEGELIAKYNPPCNR